MPRGFVKSRLAFSDNLILGSRSIFMIVRKYHTRIQVRVLRSCKMVLKRSVFERGRYLTGFHFSEDLSQPGKIPGSVLGGPACVICLRSLQEIAYYTFNRRSTIWCGARLTEHMAHCVKRQGIPPDCNRRWIKVGGSVSGPNIVKHIAVACYNLTALLI